MAGIANMVDLISFVCSISSLYYPAVCSHRDLILYTITVGKITAVQAPCYIYCRQNYKYNSNFIPKTFANLIEPKMWPLCMARNGGPSIVRPSPVGLGRQLAPNITPSLTRAELLSPRHRKSFWSRGVTKSAMSGRAIWVGSALLTNATRWCGSRFLEQHTSVGVSVHTHTSTTCCLPR